MLPAGKLFETQFDFYLHASDLFKAALSTYHDVLFTQLALSNAPSYVDTTLLWSNVVKGLTDLGQYEDAYTVLISGPYERLYVSRSEWSRAFPLRLCRAPITNSRRAYRRRDSISQLLYRMCEENAVDRLMTLNFAGLADEVEDALAFKARNADPRIRPFYSRILYTWYVSRGDYRNGGCPHSPVSVSAVVLTDVQLRLQCTSVRGSWKPLWSTLPRSPNWRISSSRRMWLP